MRASTQEIFEEIGAYQNLEHIFCIDNVMCSFVRSPRWTQAYLEIWNVTAALKKHGANPSNLLMHLKYTHVKHLWPCESCSKRVAYYLSCKGKPEGFAREQLLDDSL